MNQLAYKNSFDETTSKDYSEIINYIQAQPIDKLNSIQKKIEFVLKEQGITFGNNFDNQQSVGHWKLDLIPHIITEDEFDFIERGCKQRVTALNMFLNDIYSQGRIIFDKVIPKEIVYSDNNYLRDCVGLTVPNNVYLHLSAIDISKNEKGDFCVLDDNLAMPSGIGYSIINRQILRQQFPSLFESRQIRSTWDTTSTMLERFKECAPSNIENPEIVILSPGVFNDAYSEHEYLANKMGIPLVLPKDLVVKDNYVYMKTVNGHSRVDIIYRRIWDYYIDPVSFFEDSILGVPGLFSCVIHGNLTIVNGIGSGVATSKAILPFVDQIIEYYLSEKPILQTVDTILLNEPKVVNHVFQNINSYVIKTYQGTGGYGVFIGPELSYKKIEELKAKVHAEPYMYVAQKLTPLPHSRCFTQDRFENRYVETRFYCYMGKSFSVSSAALTRVSVSGKTLMACNSQGAGSKDTWILGRSTYSTLPTIRRYDISTSKKQILSRVADSMFWLGRYMNRVLMATNIFHILYSSEVDQLMGPQDPSYNKLLRTMFKLTATPSKHVIKTGDKRYILKFFEYAVTNKKNYSSVYNNVIYSINNAREVQNYLSNEMWIQLRKIHEHIQDIPEVDEMNEVFMVEWLESAYHNCQSFFGASLDTFSRQDLLKFVQLGRYLEHCISIIYVVRSTLRFIMEQHSSKEIANLQPFIIIILKILNSYETYQWNYQSHFEPYLAYRMLLIDKSFNNSLVNCLQEIKKILETTSNIQINNPDESPEYIADLLISRAFSFNLKRVLSKGSTVSSKPYDFIYGKSNVSSGIWILSMIDGIKMLGNKIMDRYSSVDTLTPFTVE